MDIIDNRDFLTHDATDTVMFSHVEPSSSKTGKVILLIWPVYGEKQDVNNIVEVHAS